LAAGFALVAALAGTFFGAALVAGALNRSVSLDLAAEDFFLADMDTRNDGGTGGHPWPARIKC